ncbi:DUF6296 family protein [Streptacidiphilus cavernicola]|uniref:DUF6296 family protein n=1 Tax=Streptacidiphilus cavernicola TaxID=3342716 RepID=A0ABV6W0C1_9ACTN
MTTPQPQSRFAAACYELAFAPAPAGSAPAGAPAASVVVRRTDAKGPGGHPVYTDASGDVRAEISDRGEYRMLSTSAHRRPGRPVDCRALDAGDDPVAA